MIEYDHIKPQPSKKFRVNEVFKSLTEKFEKIWQFQKSVSSKLSFYHSIKTTFNREPYLDLCKGFSRRYSTTKLRISAHDLHIEKGRYSNTPREQRICSWCKNSLDLVTVEDESHVLYECSLYSQQRSKLISNLLKMPSIEIEGDGPIGSLDVNEFNLKDNLMSILSPNSPNSSIGEQTPQCLDIHNPRTLMIEPNTPHYSKFMERRSYAVNCVCTFFFHCFDKRNNVAKEAQNQKATARLLNNIVINLLRAPTD